MATLRRRLFADENYGAFQWNRLHNIMEIERYDLRIEILEYIQQRQIWSMNTLQSNHSVPKIDDRKDVEVIMSALSNV